MLITVSNEAYIFLCSVIGGMLVAFIYDLFRIKRKTIKSSAIVIYIEDFIYWVVVALVMFGVVYYSNEGEMRGYLFIGAVLGVSLYIFVLSKPVVNMSMFIIRFVTRVLRMIWLIVTYPFRVIFSVLRIPLSFLYRTVRGFMRKTGRYGKVRVEKALTWGRLLKNIRKKI